MRPGFQVGNLPSKKVLNIKKCSSLLPTTFAPFHILLLLLYQNTTSTEGQIKYLVYCMENAILSLTADQEQMVWLIDFQGWTMASVSVKVTRETAHVLQDYYPERLGLGILYNPPRIFESFWKVKNVGECRKKEIKICFL